MKIEPWHYSLLLFPPLIALHHIISPYTKVEESFNIQATHDILTYGVPTNNAAVRLRANYDHMKFPGAVPRTFIGALALAALSKPFIWFASYDLPQQQFAVRSTLGLLNAVALVIYARAVQRACGKTVVMWFCILQGSQFHIMYYASRTLPNMFAFGISSVNLLDNCSRLMVGRYLCTFIPASGSEVINVADQAQSPCTLLPSTRYYHLPLRIGVAAWFSLVRRVILPAILIALVAGLTMTVSIDTYFWQSPRLLWPELAAFLSNIFPQPGSEGASAWGTSPWHWYFTSAFPRLLLNPLLLLLIPFGLTTALGPEILDLILPCITYAALYSFLPHKETRFLFPILPPVTTAIAISAAQISLRRRKGIPYRITTYLLLMSTTITFLFSTAVLLPLSAQTYPGSLALQSLHETASNYYPERTIDVHLTNLALQTGVTRFLEKSPSVSPLFILAGSVDGSKPEIRSGSTKWFYDKTQNDTGLYSEEAFWDRFDYVVVEEPDHALPIGGWDVVDKIPSLGTPRLLRPEIGRGYLVLGGGQMQREADGLTRLVRSMYGRWAGSAYGLIHDVLREGWGVQGITRKQFSLTGGWWVHWGLDWKLYVLKRAVK